MLWIVTLVIWAILLGIVFYKSGRPGATFWTGMLGCVLGVLTLTFGTLVLSLVLILTSIVQRTMNLRHAGRIRSIWIATGITILCLAIPASTRTAKRLQLRDQHPLVSLRHRTTPVQSKTYEVKSPAEPLSGESPRTSIPSFYSRTRAIQLLHRSAVAHFLETPSFGISRMRFPTLKALEQPDGSPIRLPQSPSTTLATYQTEEPGSYLTRPDDHGKLKQGHSNYSNWFLDADRMGLIEDLDHVAGFQSHAIFEQKFDHWQGDLNARFNDDPSSPHRRKQKENTERGFELQQLQLVGLLYHAEPVVYDLDTLPELVSAQTANTRPLDAFEQDGLQKLLKGEAVYTIQKGSHIRMLGALRSSEHCAQCHDGPTTQLLGAFSYVLGTSAQEPTELSQHTP